MVIGNTLKCSALQVKGVVLACYQLPYVETLPVLPNAMEALSNVKQHAKGCHAVQVQTERLGVDCVGVAYPR